MLVVAFAFSSLFAGCVHSRADVREASRASLVVLQADTEASLPPSGVEFLRSAHLSWDERHSATGEGRPDEILLVFTVALDPASVRPERFSIVGSDGRIFRVKDARLAPASEVDELNSVTLLGHFGDAQQIAADSVAVLSGLFTQDGRAIEPQERAVREYLAPDEVVLSHWDTALNGRCSGVPGTQSVLRLMYSDHVRLGTGFRLDMLRLEGENQEQYLPLALDDVTLARAETPPHAIPSDLEDTDNIVDLCLDRAMMPQSLQIEAGAFRDRAGHDVVAQRVEMTAGGHGA